MKWEDRMSVGLLARVDWGAYFVRQYPNRLAIWRKDGLRLSWEEAQEVKQHIWGDDVAIEVYPAQCFVVNERHTRHLWRGELIGEAVATECVHEEFEIRQVPDGR